MNYFKKYKFRKKIDLLKTEFDKFKDPNVDITTVYNLILPYKNIIFEYFQDYLNFVYNFDKGQITIEEDFGLYLKNILIKERIDSIEFGTWNGLGSTKILMDYSDVSDSIEINPFINGIAKKNLLPIKKGHRLFTGRILNLNETKINLQDSFLSYEFNKKRSIIDMWFGHLIHLIFTCEGDYILNDLKKTYDLLLIDGGGLTTYDEFLAIYPRIRKYILIDDIDGVKGKKILKYLKEDQNFNLIFSSSTRQSCVFEKTKISH
tara:strand:- start:2410 stop:3195 length:786 start_codon:yes stop_codon:yes gene_type:complete